MPVDGKLMQLRATQMNLLRMKGIDFRMVMGIYGKYEKGIPVPPEEAALYDNAIRILIQNNAADSYLSQYGHPTKEELAAKKATGKTGPQAAGRKDGSERPQGKAEDRNPPAPAAAAAPKFNLKPNFGITPRTVVIAILLVVVLALAWSFGGGGKKKPQPRPPAKAGAQQPDPGRTAPK